MLSVQTDHNHTFKHEFATVNTVKLHYVFAGVGDPVLLLPGWPQSWYAWRSVMLRLVQEGRQVYALDPRGYGDSDKPTTGYDLTTSANDIHCFLETLHLIRPGGIDVVAHDLGSWIAYAHADAFPNDVRRLVVSEATIPGAMPPTGYPDEDVNKKTWQFAFNRLQDLPELLIAGRERDFLRCTFSNKALQTSPFDTATINEYVRVLQIPGTIRATCSYYREVFSTTGLAEMQSRLSRKLHMPVLALGGQGGVGALMLKTMSLIGTRVDGGEIYGAGHFLPEECPEEFSTRVIAFWREFSDS